jgi:VanZ family protein
MIEKLFALFMKLSSPRIPVPLDKQAHFNSGAILAFVAYFFIGYWALLLVAIVAGAKEWYDYTHPNHTSDVWDWVATALGGCLGVIMYYIVEFVQKWI